jgi:hypothetical protein
LDGKYQPATIEPKKAKCDKAVDLLLSVSLKSVLFFKKGSVCFEELWALIFLEMILNMPVRTVAGLRPSGAQFASQG